MRISSLLMLAAILTALQGHAAESAINFEPLPPPVPWDRSLPEIRNQHPAPLVNPQSALNDRYEYGADCPCECTSGFCRDCGADCDPCHFRCGWYAGAALVLAKPYFEHNTAYTATSEGSNPNLTFHQVPLEYEIEATPRVWVGYENECGFGARIRYWQFDHQAQPVDELPTGTISPFTGSQSDPVLVVQSNLNGQRDVRFVAGEGDRLTIVSGLELHVVDFELTQRYRWCRTEAQLGFGIRCLHMEQDYFANVDRNQVPADFLFHRHNFDGAGPTIALDLSRPIGYCGWAVLAGARAAVLVGSADEAFAYEYFPDSRETGALSRSETEILACGEVMIGLEYKRQLNCCTEFFIQGTLEGQIYHGAGNALDTTSDLGFLGAGFSFGLHR